MKNISSFRKIFCPHCRDLQVLIGRKNNKKMLACGHLIKFKKTKSAKDLDRKYVSTPDGGLELRK